MRTHCVEFCAALKQHHAGEDWGALPMLAKRYPGLEPVLNGCARSTRSWVRCGALNAIGPAPHIQ